MHDSGPPHNGLSEQYCKSRRWLVLFGGLLLSREYIGASLGNTAKIPQTDVTLTVAQPDHAPVVLMVVCAYFLYRTPVDWVLSHPNVRWKQLPRIEPGRRYAGYGRSGHPNRGRAFQHNYGSACCRSFVHRPSLHLRSGDRARWGGRGSVGAFQGEGIQLALPRLVRGDWRSLGGRGCEHCILQCALHRLVHAHNRCRYWRRRRCVGFLPVGGACRCRENGSSRVGHPRR